MSLRLTSRIERIIAAMEDEDGSLGMSAYLAGVESEGAAQGAGPEEEDTRARPASRYDGVSGRGKPALCVAAVPTVLSVEREVEVYEQLPAIEFDGDPECATVLRHWKRVFEANKLYRLVYLAAVT